MFGRLSDWRRAVPHYERRLMGVLLAIDPKSCLDVVAMKLNEADA